MIFRPAAQAPPCRSLWPGRRAPVTGWAAGEQKACSRLMIPPEPADGPPGKGWWAAGRDQHGV